MGSLAPNGLVPNYKTPTIPPAVRHVNGGKGIGPRLYVSRHHSSARSLRKEQGEAEWSTRANSNSVFDCNGLFLRGYIHEPGRGDTASCARRVTTASIKDFAGLRLLVALLQQW
jgi:hypothetical protein